jgi:hypothetical protein
MGAACPLPLGLGSGGVTASKGLKILQCHVGPAAPLKISRQRVQADFGDDHALLGKGRASDQPDRAPLPASTSPRLPNDRLLRSWRRSRAEYVHSGIKRDFAATSGF